MLKSFLIFIVLSIVFAGLFIAFKNDAGISYRTEIQNIPSVRIFGSSSGVEDTILKFGVAVGAILGIIAFITSAILFGILRIIRIPRTIASGVSNILVYGGVAGLGYELVYLEEKNSVLSSAVVSYVGKPLLYSGGIAVILAIIFFIISLMGGKELPPVARKIAMTFVLISSSLLLSGCSLLGNITQVGCEYTPDGKQAAHCYQEAAVQKNNEVVCDKAPQGDEFKAGGSNPPQDKCYYMVAANKRDPNVCDNIKGGVLSYDVTECKTTVLDSNEKEINDTLKKTDSGKNLSPEELQKIQSQLEKDQKMNGMMSTMARNINDMNLSMVRNLR